MSEIQLTTWSVPLSKLEKGEIRAKIKSHFEKDEKREEETCHIKEAVINIDLHYYLVRDDG